MGRRREAGRKYLDRTTDDPPLWWQVRLFYPSSVGDAQGFAERFTNALGQQAGVRDVASAVKRGAWRSRWLARRKRSHDLASGSAGVAVSFSVRAATHKEAEELASRVEEQAFEEASSSLAKERPVIGFSQMDHIEPASEQPPRST